MAVFVINCCYKIYPSKKRDTRANLLVNGTCTLSVTEVMFIVMTWEYTEQLGTDRACKTGLISET